MTVLDFRLDLLTSSFNSQLVLINVISMFVTIDNSILFNVLFQNISNLCLTRLTLFVFRIHIKYAFNYRIITHNRTHYKYCF